LQVGYCLARISANEEGGIEVRVFLRIALGAIGERMPAARLKMEASVRRRPWSIGTTLEQGLESMV